MGNELQRLLATEWILVCYLALKEKIEKLNRENPEDPRLPQLEKDAKIISSGWSTGQWPSVKTILEIIQRHDLPWFDYFMEKGRLLKKYGLESWSFSKPSLEDLQLPIIFIGGSSSKEEILAQMEIWACRKHKDLKLNHLYSYLSKWIQDEDLRQEVAASLIENWKTPLSKFSFREYCKQLCLSFSRPKREIATNLENYGSKTYGHSKLELQFPCSVSSAALALSAQVNKSPETIKRWLYRQMEKGVIPGCSSSLVVADDGFAKEKRSYRLDESGFQKALDLLKAEAEDEIKKKRGLLIEYLMEKRGVGRRAAQRWLKRRLDAGKSWEEIYREIRGA